MCLKEGVRNRACVGERHCRRALPSGLGRAARPNARVVPAQVRCCTTHGASQEWQANRTIRELHEGAPRGSSRATGPSPGSCSSNSSVKASARATSLLPPAAAASTAADHPSSVRRLGCGRSARLLLEAPMHAGVLLLVLGGASALPARLRLLQCALAPRADCCCRCTAIAAPARRGAFEHTPTSRCNVLQPAGNRMSRVYPYMLEIEANAERRRVHTLDYNDASIRT